MVKDHGPSVKDDEQYERLRQKGESKQKAARMILASNTPSGISGRTRSSGRW
jgi:hypothetical protein